MYLVIHVSECGDHLVSKAFMNFDQACDYANGHRPATVVAMQDALNTTWSYPFLRAAQIRQPQGELQAA